MRCACVGHVCTGVKVGGGSFFCVGSQYPILHQIYTSDSNQFPEFAENAYIEELIDEPTDAELADRCCVVLQ